MLDKRVYPQRIAVHCAAHARRKFDGLLGISDAGKEAVRHPHVSSISKFNRYGIGRVRSCGLTQGYRLNASMCHGFALALPSLL